MLRSPLKTFEITYGDTLAWKKFAELFDRLHKYMSA